MFQLLLSHFAVDGRGVPDSANGFLTIPLGTGGRAPELREGRGWGFHTGSLCPAGRLHTQPQNRPKHKPLKTVPAGEASACMDLQQRGRSILSRCGSVAARVLHSWGISSRI